MRKETADKPGVSANRIMVVGVSLRRVNRRATLSVVRDEKNSATRETTAAGRAGQRVPGAGGVVNLNCVRRRFRGRSGFRSARRSTRRRLVAGCGREVRRGRRRVQKGISSLVSSAAWWDAVFLTLCIMDVAGVGLATGLTAGFGAYAWYSGGCAGKCSAF